MSLIRLFSLFFALTVAMPCGLAAESEPARYPGLREIRLVTDIEAVRPGESFTVGLLLRHEEGFHTYWKSPGIVGVAPHIEWKDLPIGFQPGEIQWPAPQTTKMAQLTAWGYETDTCLLIPFTVPADLGDRESVTLKARIGWMCCATSCHPGWHEFSLTLPVHRDASAQVARDEEWSAIFAESRSRMPVAAPAGWQFTAREVAADSIQLVVHAPADQPGVDFSKVYFFCDDNQVDSDEPQRVAELSGVPGAVLTFTRPEFSPEKPKALSGVLFHPDGWPGTKSRWIIASAPW